MLKKFVSIILCCIAAAVCLCGCSRGSLSLADSSKYSIVCTIFPEYDWTREIIGDNSNDFKISYLLGSGTDMHCFEPSADDMAAISSCDIFIYTGGASDKWAENLLANADKQNMQIINLMEIMGENLMEESLPEIMITEEDAEYDIEIDENGNRRKIKKAPVYDEHVWLSLRNAEVFCQSIETAVEVLDPSGKDKYQKNLEAYVSKLNALDDKYSELFKATKASEKTMIFGDRFPFRYFFADYNLNYFAPFAGCSSETAATPENIEFISSRIDYLRADTVFISEISDSSTAQGIISRTADKDQKIVILNSAQSVTKSRIKDGTTYLSIMLDNYDILRNLLRYDDD